MVTVQFVTVPMGSQFLDAMSSTDPVDKNDFKVYLVWSENVTGLSLSNISFTIVSGPGGTRNLTPHTQLLSLRGSKSVYELTIRPPNPIGAGNSNPWNGVGTNPTTAVITLTIAANAVTQGNPVTTKTIRISRTFPDVDADVPTSLFNATGTFRGIAVSSTRIFIGEPNSVTRKHRIRAYTYAGVEQVSERVTLTFEVGRDTLSTLQYINGDFLIDGIYRADREGNLIKTLSNLAGYAVVPTRLGFLNFSNSDIFRVYPFSGTSSADVYNITATEHVALEAYGVGSNLARLARAGDLLFIVSSSNAGRHCYLGQITDADGIEILSRLNININSYQLQDIAISQDTLYIFYSSQVYTLDIKKYRTLAKNTKTTIYPVILSHKPNQRQQTLDLQSYSPDAERIVWDVGFDKPAWLTLLSNNRLQIDTTGMTAGGVRTCFVRCRAINRIDSVPFHFYLVVEDKTPTIRDISEFAILEGSTFDLLQLTENATRVVLSPDSPPLLQGNTLINSVLTMTTAQTIKLRAHNDNTGQYTDSA